MTAGDRDQGRTPEGERGRAPEGDRTPEQEAARRRRLAEVFGDVLPETTSDDRDDDRERGTADDWLRRQVPPHHGS